MEPVEINVTPPARILFNSLYRTGDPDLLTQDILAVDLSDDVFLDVGWYPEHDPLGEYMVVVFRSDWENQLFKQSFKSINEVITVVNLLIHDYLPLTEIAAKSETNNRPSSQ